MSEPPAAQAPGSGEETPIAVRAQILATEHWSLLATRSQAWNESFSRASWFLTVVSAGVVALALVAQATDVGTGFRVFALLLLPVLIGVGLATFVRMMHLNNEDVSLVVAMNRLRRGYLDLAPELEPYFVTGHQDDMAGIMQTYFVGPRTRLPAAQYLTSTVLLVGMVDAVLVGAMAALAGDALGTPLAVTITVGAVATILALSGLAWVMVRQVNRTWLHRPRFPA